MFLLIEQIIFQGIPSTAIAVASLRRYLLTCVFGCPASSRGEGAEFRATIEVVELDGWIWRITKNRIVRLDLT